MRSIASPRVRGLVALGALLLLGLVGCSKKTTAPNSRPVPEGQQDGRMLMMGWHEQVQLAFSIVDPGTPNSPSDDVLGSFGLVYWADTAGVRTTTFDASQSNQIEPFKLLSSNNVSPMFDFMLDPTVRRIGSDFDSYDFEDFAPGANPAYYARGVLNGQVTTASPVTNRAGAFQHCDDNMIFIPPPKKPARDSVLDVRFGDDPRAAFYVIEISNASNILGTGDVFTNNRLLYGIPSPLLPGTRPEQGFLFLLPGGLGQTGVQFRLARQHWPLFFHIRVSAFDTEGRMVNRINDYLHTVQADAGNNVHFYETLGGSVEVLDPYPDPINPVSPPPVLTRDDAIALFLSFANPIPQGPAHALGRSGGVPNPGPVSSAFSDAMRQMLASPALSQQSVEQRLRVIQAKLAKAPTTP